ncbi:hypothetical protein BRC81_07705 [Halobacteriales archaeon QS_1_68_20]|nr:MAG: hypothetical protein BRC81_07705 [Halobacteriales archaeon QS_1_68_20]
MFLSDVDILDYLRDEDVASPKDISEDRRRENVIRLQCRYLREAGLVVSPAQDVFSLSDEGIRYLSGDRRLRSSGGYFEWDRVLDLPDRRISCCPR